MIFSLPYPPHGMSLDNLPKGVSRGGLLWFYLKGAVVNSCRWNNGQGTDSLPVQLCRELMVYP